MDTLENPVQMFLLSVAHKFLIWCVSIYTHHVMMEYHLLSVKTNAVT